MHIKHIELTDFRNYESLKLDFHQNVNLILGNNAQGKTNLLEAIYITSIGRSFRTNRTRAGPVWTAGRQDLRGSGEGNLRYVSRDHD